MPETARPPLPQRSAKPFQLQWAPDVWLDARRAVWLAEERALVVADLHLGYIWAQRAAGSLLPLSAPEETITRLAALAREYGARQVVVLGDIVHRAVPVEPIRAELRRLCHEMPDLDLQLIAGNHDRALDTLLQDCQIAQPLTTHLRLGPHQFLHGDRPSAEAAPAPGGFIFMGHEHPAISLGDGVTRMKCPCFLARPGLLVLPAFSTWAAGSEVRGGHFLSPLARAAKFTHAIAILAEKLLPVPL